MALRPLPGVTVRRTLVSLARAGRDRAFVAIAARYKRELVGLARRVGAQSHAEDVVQQALLNALTALRAGAEVQHVRGWLYQIVRNAAVKVAVRELIEHELTENLMAADNTEEEVERRLLARTTLAAIAVLPDGQRDAFVKTAVQGRSRSEVALSVGVSEGAVRQLVYRARASLRTGVTAVTPLSSRRASLRARSLSLRADPRSRSARTGLRSSSRRRAHEPYPLARCPVDRRALRRRVRAASTPPRT